MSKQNKNNLNKNTNSNISNQNVGKHRVGFSINIGALGFSIVILTAACTPAVLLFRSCSDKSAKETIKKLRQENDSLQYVIHNLSQQSNIYYYDKIVKP